MRCAADEVRGALVILGREVSPLLNKGNSARNGAGDQAKAFLPALKRKTIFGCATENERKPKDPRK